jgi:predicted aspartyl protease
MTVGSVNNRLAAIIPIRFRGPTGRDKVVRAMIDTGSTVALTIPLDLITELEFDAISIGYAVMADGSECEYRTYNIEFLWGDEWHRFTAPALGTESLIGVPLLAGSTLQIDYVPGGTVAVRLIEA